MRLLLALLIAWNVFLSVMVVKLANAAQEWMQAMEDLHNGHQHERYIGNDCFERSGPVVPSAVRRPDDGGAS